MVNKLFEQLSQQSQQTKADAEKVAQQLLDSAKLLVEAKESMIIAMLQENLDIEMISIATKMPIEAIQDIQQQLYKKYI